jgi:hypothetical protein
MLGLRPLDDIREADRSAAVDVLAAVGERRDLSDSLVAGLQLRVGDRARSRSLLYWRI